MKRLLGWDTSLETLDSNMYARIAPLKRLPKHFSICDYLVPEHLEDKIQVGQLITIPFRKSKIFGLVLSLGTESKYADKVKPVENIVHEVPFVRENEVKFFQDLAIVYHDALGGIIESALPPLQKRKLTSIELLPLAKNTAAKKIIQFRQYLSADEHANIIQSFCETQTLILIPEIHRIENIAKLFSNKKVAVWHSELSPKQKFATWLQIRNGEADIIIGTRSSIFLTFFDLKNIVIIDEEHKDHKSEEAAPRFSVKDVAILLAENHGAEITLTSSHPSSETYYNLYQHNYEIPGVNIESNKTLGIISVPNTDAPVFIDLKTELHGHKTDYFLSSRVQEQIASTDRDVFLFLNRRGSATSLYCQSCGYKDACPTCHNARIYYESQKLLLCHYCKSSSPIPLQCPKCGTNILQLRGYGTQELEKTLQRLQIETNAQIIRMDSDVEEKLRPDLLKQPGKKIIIGTEMAFQYLDWSTIDLTVCINLDRMLTTPEFNGEERLWHLVQYMQYSRPEQSTLYIQTHNPEHAFWKTFSDADLFYRTDLKRRKVFSYPPYSYLIKYMYGAETSVEAKKQATEMKNKMAQILTNEGKKATIYDPLELHPHFYRKQYWYGIIVLVEPNTWMEKTREINALLDENWKVDPRPNSILNS